MQKAVVKGIRSIITHDGLETASYPCRGQQCLKSSPIFDKLLS